jgi:hypothetical protein
MSCATATSCTSGSTSDRMPSFAGGRPVVALQRIASLVVAAAWLAACASFVPFAVPQVQVTGAALDRIDGADVYFSVQTRWSNPNERELYVGVADATLAIEGERIAAASLAAPLTLPAHGEADATLTAHAGMDSFLRAVAAAMRRGAGIGVGAIPSMRYAVDGVAVVSGTRIPFRREGDLIGTSKR